MKTLKEGDWILYKNGPNHEIGLVKRVNDDNKSVYAWYHLGGTAACTPMDTIVDSDNDLSDLLVRFFISTTHSVLKNREAIASLMIRRESLLTGFIIIDTDDLIDL